MLSMEKCFPLRYYHPLRFESSTLRKQKKDDRKNCRLILRRVLDSNQWIPYDIGSLANCWFQPLTQLSVAVTLKKVCKYSAFSQQCKIISIKLEELSKNYLLNVKYLPARKL